MASENNSIDVLGIKPIADSVNKVTDGAVNGASAFLSRICLPAAEEFGLLLRDKVSSWRTNNAVKIANSAQKLLEQRVCSVALHAHPRIVYSALEQGSWVEEEYVQKMWGGLLASSCTESGKDESNLIFLNLLANLTSSQAKLIGYICQNSVKEVTVAGWLVCNEDYTLGIEKLKEIMGVVDIHHLDRELDHLRSVELIIGGFDQQHQDADVTPTSLCLQLYCRCQGFVGSPVDFYGLEP